MNFCFATAMIRLEYHDIFVIIHLKNYHMLAFLHD